MPVLFLFHITATCSEERPLCTTGFTLLPNIWRVLSPTLFVGSLTRFGPKHSTSVPFNVKFAVPVSVDEKEVALLPNSAPGLAVKALPGPHVDAALAVLCVRIHSLLPFTLQMVTPFLSPPTVQLKIKLLPGQVGGAVMNCPATGPVD